MASRAKLDELCDVMQNRAVRANTERSEEARSAHVPASVSLHARADEWDGPPLEWGPFGTEVIAAELVACTLGQRSRPELVMPEAKPRLLPDSRLWRIMDRIGLSVMRPGAFRALGDTTA